MVTIRKHLVSNSIISKVTSGKGNLKKKVCIHETDNTRSGANANAHARLQANGNSRQASWHYQVDDKEAVQSFKHDIRCWHAGTSKGNNEAIAIEICVNSDGNYKKAVQNAAELTAKILHDEKLTINDVVQHNYYSGKNCPRNLRAGKVIPWSSFLQMVKANLELLNKPKQTTTRKLTTQTTTKAKTKEPIGTIKVLVNNLNYYDGPRWSKPSGTVKKNTILTVMEKVNVQGYPQYKLKSGTYITASPTYVKFTAKK